MTLDMTELRRVAEAEPVTDASRTLAALLDRIAELEQALTQVNRYRKDDQARCFRLVARAEAWKRAALNLSLDGHTCHVTPCREMSCRLLAQAKGLDPAEPEERCSSCDGTGDIHSADGEWQGECPCGVSAEPEEK